jgi:hypothetical protein
MSNNNILDRNNCIKILKKDTKVVLHPLINSVMNFDIEKKDNLCIILPQLIDGILFYNVGEKKLVQNIKNKSDKKNLLDTTNFSESQSSNTSVRTTLSDTLVDNKLINFTLPINSSNFLDVVFGIENIQHLYSWIDTYDTEDKNTINLILDLYWKNYYYTIDDNLNDFIRLNQRIVYLLFNKDIDLTTMTKITNKLIRRNYGKKIKYLDKIKKYLRKYI